MGRWIRERGLRAVGMNLGLRVRVRMLGGSEEIKLYRPSGHA
jgi:hypothetical protein